MNANDIVVTLCASRADLQTQIHLNALATQIADLVRAQGVFSGLTVLPLAGSFTPKEASQTALDITAGDRDGAGQADEDDDDLPEEPAQEDVLTRLAKRGVPITYRLIGRKKVACLVDQWPENLMGQVEWAFSRFENEVRVLVVGGWSGEPAASVLSGAPVGTVVYSTDPDAGHEHLMEHIAKADLDELHARLGVRNIAELPDDPSGLDAILICADRLATTAELTRLSRHLGEKGMFFGLRVTRDVQRAGAVGNDLWALSRVRFLNHLDDLQKQQEAAVSA